MLKELAAARQVSDLKPAGKGQPRLKLVYSNERVSESPRLAAMTIASPHQAQYRTRALQAPVPPQPARKARTMTSRSSGQRLHPRLRRANARCNESMTVETQPAYCRSDLQAQLQETAMSSDTQRR